MFLVTWYHIRHKIPKTRYSRLIKRGKYKTIYVLLQLLIISKISELLEAVDWLQRLYATDPGIIGIPILDKFTEIKSQHLSRSLYRSVPYDSEPRLRSAGGLQLTVEHTTRIAQWTADGNSMTFKESIKPPDHGFYSNLQSWVYLIQNIKPLMESFIWCGILSYINLHAVSSTSSDRVLQSQV